LNGYYVSEKLHLTLIKLIPYLKKFLGITILIFSIPFIVQTALATEEDKEDIIKAGFNSYITKPIDFKQLISVVFELLKEKKEFI
jgi:CheY-like chemotaxis protein